MIKTISTFYSLIKWLIFILLFLGSITLFVIESPSTILTLLKKPLQELNITYGEMEGGLLSGFSLKDINYNNQIKAKKVALKIDFDALKDRVLVIDNLILEDAQIDRDFLTSLIESNSSQESKREENISLPFDRILVKNSDISVKNIDYQNYHIQSAKLHLSNIDTDMKKKNSGDFTFLLDSNATQADIKGSLKNENYEILVKIEPNREFISPYIEEYNLTLLSNPKLKLNAKGNLDEVKYDVLIDRLSLKQNDYLVNSRLFRTKGKFNIKENSLKNSLNTELDGNVAHLKLNAITSLDLDDINSTLIFNIDTEIEPKKIFISKLLEEQNITVQKLPKITIFAKGDLKQVHFKTMVKGLKAKQNEFSLDLKDLELKGEAKPIDGDVKSKLLTHFNSSVANGRIALDSTLNFKDINNSLQFNLDSKFKSHKKYLKDINLYLLEDGKLALNAKGNMKRVGFTLNVNDFRAKQSELSLDLKELELKGEVKPIDGDIKSKLLTHFNSSVADGKIALDSTLNFKDINSSLQFDLDSDFKSHRKYIGRYLKDTNITLLGDSRLGLNAKGSMKRVGFRVSIDTLRAKQNDIDMSVKNLLLKGESRPIDGNLALNLSTNIKSTIANGDIEATTKLNTNDINNSLKFKTDINLLVDDRYINRFLKDSNITIKEKIPLKLSANGDINRVKAKFDLKSKVLAQKIVSTITLSSKKIDLNLKNHIVAGELKLNSDAKSISLNLNSQFKGDYTKPKEMRLKGKVSIDRFNGFGVNLNEFTPVNIDINKLKRETFVKLNSKLLKLDAKSSSDFDKINFYIKSKKIYPSRVVKLPDELKDKFIKVNLYGKSTISKEYFTIKGYIASNKNFKIKIDAKSRADGLKVDMGTKHLKLKAQGNLKSRDIEATLNVDSLTKVQEEFARLYPFEIVPIKGAITLKAKVKGEDIHANIISKKIELEAFNVENIDIDAEYSKELLTINRLNLETTEFEDNRLNRKFYLNRKGKIHLGKRRDVILDIHPNILVKLDGTEENLNGNFSIDKLPLGHPDYGEVILSTNIDYEQIGKKKKVQGNVTLDNMKLLYESKFLDPAHDSDVVIITKKDKKRKKEKNSFIEDTYIDVDISARDAKYKTRDIDLGFRVDLKAKKEFGKNLGMLGRIKEINGIVEQPPKTFRVVDSSVVFRGLKEINPMLDITVQHELPDVLITIKIHGDANRPKIDFSSEPQMPKKDILSYLLFGVSTAKLSDKDTNLGREAELFIMNQAARDLAYELELDRVYIKDDGTGEGYAIQVGKKIDKKTMFVVESSKEGNSFILEYDVNKNIKIELGQHQKTVPSQSIDIFFRKKFR